MRLLPSLTLCFLAVARLPAQLPDGTVAPDFIATDINGQSRHLYEMLDSGKIVLMEVSATWCAPCWAYHNGHAVQDFYAEHGPGGDGAAEVLFIEGDPATNLNCLFGNQGCNSFSPGNWIEGTNFPIFNNDSIGALYDVQYYPTLYIICPNRKVHEVGQLSNEGLWQEANRCPVASGVNNAGIFYYDTGSPLSEVCGAVTLEPHFTLINLGSSALTGAYLELRWNNTVVDSFLWSGYLPTYGETTIVFDTLLIDTPGQLKTSVPYINGGTDDDLSNNTRIDLFSSATGFNSQQVLMKIRTDQYGSELYWELRDDDGAVLDFGGNQAVGPNGGGQFTAGAPNGPGAYGNNVIIRDTLQLPFGGCYSLHFVDAYGDGICCDYGFGYYRLYNMDNPALPLLSGGEFSANDDRGFGVPGLVHTEEPFSEADFSVSIYPNPAGELFYVEAAPPMEMPLSVHIFNAFGQLQYRDAFKPASGLWKLTIPVQDWPEGVYFVQTGNVVQKLLLKRAK